MNVSINSIITNFEQNTSELINNGEKGSLTLQDVKKLDSLVNTFRSQISNLEPSADMNSSASSSLESLDLSLLKRVAYVKEKNFSLQIIKFTEAVQSGTLNFQDLQDNVLSFGEKMDILLNKAPKGSQGEIKLSFIGVLDKKGDPEGVLHMTIKPGELFDSTKTLLSQINDPLYREELLSQASQTHYTFEFFDNARQSEIDQKREELATKKQALDDLGNLLNLYAEDLDEVNFNKEFKPTQRALFHIPQDKQLNENEIADLFGEHETELFMFPVIEESINDELAKATISARFSKDGSIGELKSVNIHSPNMGGKQLMDFWDGFCSYIKPTQVYLEDDAKIEGGTGSYNLRLFRLMSLPDKASWYTDGYQYHSYHKGDEGLVMTSLDSKEQQINYVQPFKTMTAERAREQLLKPGMKPSDTAIELLDQYVNSNKMLSDIVKQLGDKVRTGEQLHKELDTLLGVISLFSKYEGLDEELNNLKENATVLTHSRFYRKNYS